MTDVGRAVGQNPLNIDAVLATPINVGQGLYDYRTTIGCFSQAMIQNSTVGVAERNWKGVRHRSRSAEPLRRTVPSMGEAATLYLTTGDLHRLSRWSEVITHVPCGGNPEFPAGRLLITSTLDAIDGVGGTLGSAGPDSVWRGCTTVSIEGSMRFDIADIADLEADGSFEGVVLHEMGHVIGIR